MIRLRSVFGVALASLLGAAPGAAQEASVVNAGFEDGTSGAAPAGWQFSGEGYRAALDSEAARSGAQGLRVSYSGATPPPRNVRGILMQSIDATAYLGRRIRLSAAVREEPDGAPTELWLRVDGPGAVSAFQNSGARRTPDRDWTILDLVLPVAEDSRAIVFGVLANGGGAVRLDDFAIVDIGDVGEGDIPARPLTEQGLENLVAFARLFGDVRYFHPSDEAAGANWDAVALAAIERVEAADDASALREALLAAFAPFAPTLEIAVAGELPQAVPLAGDVIAWRRVGLGGSPGIYGGARGAPSAGLPDTVEIPLAQGLVARIPLKVVRGADGRTAPVALLAPPEIAKPDGFLPSANDRNSRLTAVIVAWNILQHFYPYWDAVEVDWPAQLSASLSAAAIDADGVSFDATIERLVAAALDGHGNAASASIMSLASLPLQWAWIEDSLVITAAAEGIGLRPGDVVTAIDGQAVERLIAAIEERMAAATPGWRRIRALQRLAATPLGETRTLTLERAGGEKVDVAISRERASPPPPAEARPEAIAELEPGVLYVDLSRLTLDMLNENVDRLAAARGLVFDLRGYPVDGAPTLLRHLSDETLQSAQFNLPTFEQPDQAGATFRNVGWTLPPLAPRFSDRVVFLTDWRAVSYAESIMGIVENYRLGEIVGATTAGTNGNIDRYWLLTGHELVWSGMQVLKHDGSRHHGVGIVPTVPAERTIEGVRAGRDEVLEVGLTIARGD
jgi:C-terminal processing protease CtpA/Prc